MLELHDVELKVASEKCQHLQLSICFHQGAEIFSFNYFHQQQHRKSFLTQVSIFVSFYPVSIMSGLILWFLIQIIVLELTDVEREYGSIYSQYVFLWSPA